MSEYADQRRQPMLVIFDCDGVLVNSEGIAAQVLTKHLNALGLRGTLEETLSRYKGKTKKSCLLDIEMRLQQEKLASVVDVHEFWLEMQTETLLEFDRHLKPIAGIQVVLSKLSEKSIPFCVASNGEFNKMLWTLTKTQLLSFFEGRMFSVEDVSHGKPHPDLFLYAAQRMGVPAKQSIVIEDSVLGVQAAQAAGMTVLAYSPASNNSAISALGVTCFERMNLLPELLFSAAH